MKPTKEDYIKAISESDTMYEAAAKLGVHFNTFKRNATKYGVYNPTPQSEIARRGGLSSRNNKIPLEEILEGKHPQYHTSKLSKRIRKEKKMEYRCSGCGVEDEYNGKPLTLELDHINGIRYDHRLENLRFLCPNCHSQTGTYRSKNRKMEGTEIGFSTSLEN